MYFKGLGKMVNGILLEYAECVNGLWYWVAPKKFRLNKLCIESCTENAVCLHFLLESYRKEEIQLFSAKLHRHLYSTLQWRSILALQKCNACLSSPLVRAFATIRVTQTEGIWSKFYLKRTSVSSALKMLGGREAEIH